jgi:molybdopterin converting factor small subunit
MEIEVSLFATLRKYSNDKSKIELEEGANVSDFIERIGVPPSEVAIILVNGRHAHQDQRLHDGETVSLFPAIAGG